MVVFECELQLCQNGINANVPDGLFSKGTSFGYPK